MKAEDKLEEASYFFSKIKDLPDSINKRKEPRLHFIQFPSRISWLVAKLFMGWLVPKWYEGDVELKEYMCVQVGHHKNVGKTIEEWQRNGWRLHTYQAQGSPTLVNHYLLFERGE